MATVVPRTSASASATASASVPASPHAESSAAPRPEHEPRGSIFDALPDGTVRRRSARQEGRSRQPRTAAPSTEAPVATAATVSTMSIRLGASKRPLSAEGESPPRRVRPATVGRVATRPPAALDAATLAAAPPAEFAESVRRALLGKHMQGLGEPDRTFFLQTARTVHGAGDLALAAADARAVLEADAMARAGTPGASTANRVPDDRLRLARIIGLAHRITLGPAESSLTGESVDDMLHTLDGIDPAAMLMGEGESLLVIPGRVDQSVHGAFGALPNVARTPSGFLLTPNAYRDGHPEDVMRFDDAHSTLAVGLHVAIGKLRREWPAAQDAPGLLRKLLAGAMEVRTEDRFGLLALLYRVADVLRGVSPEASSTVGQAVMALAERHGALAPDRCADMLLAVLRCLPPGRQTGTRMSDRGRLAVVRDMAAVMKTLPPPPADQGRYQGKRIEVLDRLCELGLGPGAAHERGTIADLAMAYAALRRRSTVCRPERADLAHPLVAVYDRDVRALPIADAINLARPMLDIALRETGRTRGSLIPLLTAFASVQADMDDAGRLMEALPAAIDERAMTREDRDELNFGLSAPYWYRAFPRDVDAIGRALLRMPIH